MNIAEAIKCLREQVKNPPKGLPEDLFHYISSATPIINVELLIKNENENFLLSWRDDPYAGKGWHMPGGVIRFKETIKKRIDEVARTEIGTFIDSYSQEPVAINEIFDHEREVRSHFISLLYRCSLPVGFIPENKGTSRFAPGYLMWHKTCPRDLVKLHEIYRKYL